MQGRLVSSKDAIGVLVRRAVIWYTFDFVAQVLEAVAGALLCLFRDNWVVDRGLEASSNAARVLV